MRPLTHNASILSETAGRRVLDIRGKWINWLDDQTWQPIDCSFLEVGQRWESRSGPFAVSIPKQANRPIEIVSTNKWDVFQKTRISDADFAMRVTPQDVSPVASVMESPDTVAFRGAYPFGDLVYRLSHGRAPRFQKLARITSIPQGTGPLRITFRITHDAAQTRTSDRTLDVSDLDTQRQMAIDVKAELDRNGRIQDVMRKQFLLAELRKTSWDGSPKNLRSSLELRAAGSTGLRGLGIKPAIAWDSSETPQRIPITLELFRQPDGSVLMTKIIPRAFLASATYPIYTDTTSTFYPDANTETTSVDGVVYRTSDNSTWSSLRTSAGTTATDNATSNVSIQFLAGTTSNWGRLYRSIVLFDTSALDDAATINSAIMSVYGSTKSDTNSNTPSTNICGSTPASNTALATGDYLQTGTTKYCDTDISYSAYDNAGYNDFTLNSTGLSNVSKTGVTKFSVKNANYDIADVAPTRVNSSTAFRVAMIFADNSGTSNDPKLVVDYTVPAATGNMLLVF